MNKIHLNNMLELMNPKYGPLPSISVVMPVYNAVRYVEEATESILNQTFQDFEFIIIDDGSNDGSRAILKHYANRDSRIRLISRNNRGLVATLNEGIAMAHSPLVARMDADDISLPKRFAIQKAFLDANPEVLCVGGRYETIDANGRLLSEMLYLPTDDANIQNRLLAGDCVLPHPSVIFRRQEVMGLGGYDPSMELAEDIDLWIRLGEIGKLANVPEVIVRYRVTDTSLSSTFHLNQLRILQKVCDRACKRRGVQVEFINKGWIPTNRLEKFEEMRKRWKYGLLQGDVWMAIDYAWKAIRIMPYHPKAWRLLAHAIFMIKNKGKLKKAIREQQDGNSP